MSSPRYSVDDFNDISGYTTADNDTPTDRDSWLPLNLADLPERPPTRPTLGKTGDIGLLYPGKRHVFSGPQESAKTLAAYHLGLQVIRQGHPIVIIDFEMGEYDARDRLRDLGATNTDFGQLHYIAPEQPATIDRISLLIALQPALVIIDAAAGAYDTQGLDDNKRQDVEKLSALYIRLFWRATIATIMLDHVVKNSETRGNYAIGSERKVGAADVHLGFSVITPISRGHTGLYKVTTHKDRGGYLKRGTLAEMELRSDPNTHQIDCQFRPAQELADGEVWMPTKVMQKVSELLERQTTPVTRNTVQAELGGRKDYTLKAIDHLVRLGYATETDGPNRAKLLKSTRPFTVYEWEHQPDTPVVPGGSPVVPGTTPSGGSHPSPPYGGRNHPDTTKTTPVVPDEPARYDWVDELTPKDEPPHDLFANHIPFD